MNLKENLNNALDEKEVEKTPAASITSVALMESMDKMGIHFPEGHTDPEKMAKIGASAYEYAGVEGINIPFDLAIESEAIGCTVDLGYGEKIPEITSTPFEEPADIEIPDDFLENGRIPVVGKSLQILHEQYDDKNVPIIGGMIGPFTLLGQLLGIENLLKYLNTDLYEVEDALDIVGDGLIELIHVLNECEPDAVCMYEPSVAADLLDPAIFHQLVCPVLESISEEMEFRGVLHVCGNSTPIIKDMLSCGFKGISIEDSVDINYIKQAKKELKSPTQICGNISTNQTLFMKSPKEVIDESLIALEKGVDVLGPSCCVAPHTPLKNMQAMVEARDKFYS
ncbi:MAG: MtaA/CmuA family methyltransferase [Methanobacteriaceae archaeon]|nr:MtaA/CmuA family methyltransferase [Methanobacteriaceae archaeon]